MAYKLFCDNVLMFINISFSQQIITKFLQHVRH